MVNFKIYDVTDWTANNNKHILPNISRSKSNQTMKFDHLIEYNMKNTFLKNHLQNVVENLVPETFRKNQNSVYLWINSLKYYNVCFYCLSKLRSTKIYKK